MANISSKSIKVVFKNTQDLKNLIESEKRERQKKLEKIKSLPRDIFSDEIKNLLFGIDHNMLLLKTNMLLLSEAYTEIDNAIKKIDRVYTKLDSIKNEFKQDQYLDKIKIDFSSVKRSLTRQKNNLLKSKDNFISEWTQPAGNREKDHLKNTFLINSFLALKPIVSQNEYIYKILREALHLFGWEKNICFQNELTYHSYNWEKGKKIFPKSGKQKNGKTKECIYYNKGIKCTKWQIRSNKDSKYDVLCSLKYKENPGDGEVITNIKKRIDTIISSLKIDKSRYFLYGNCKKYFIENYMSN